MVKTQRKLFSLALAGLLTVSIFLLAFVNGYIKAGAVNGDTVYLQAPPSWSSAYCYMWVNGTENNNAAWPGAQMEKVEGNLYTYTVPGNFDMIIFNNGSDAGKTGDMNFPGDNKLYDFTAKTWSDYIDTKEPTVVSSVADQTAFTTETLSVTLTLKNATSGTYSIDGGKPVTFTDEATVVLGQGKKGNTSISLLVTATDGTLDYEKTYTFIKRYRAPSAGTSDEDGHTTQALSGYFSTNPDGQVGVNKTITIDGNISDWDSSMLIAQGVANDDPRVYRPNSMYEIAVDDYVLYAAWDAANLYLMWELANVQDVVAPNDTFPLSQGNLWIYNLPVFLGISTDPSKTGDGSFVTAPTIWDSGITFTTHIDTLVAFSTNGSNGPFIYQVNDDNQFDYATANAQTGIELMWGNQTISQSLMGIDQAYGTYNDRVPGDTLSDGSAWVDFYAKGHNKALDMFYEMSIPLSSLGITKSDIEQSGIGLIKISTFGTSGMDSLPYDPSMSDNADLPYSGQENNSNEKEDEDNITVPLARVGKMLSSGTAPAEIAVDFGADKSSPQQVGTSLTLSADAYHGTAPYTYKFMVNGNVLSDSSSNTAKWTPAAPGTYTLSVEVKDSRGESKTITKDYTVSEGEILPPPTDPEPTDPEIMLGDLDGNGRVDLTDVLETQKHIAAIKSLTGNAFIAADVDQNGKIDLTDVLMMQKRIANIIPDFN